MTYPFRFGVVAASAPSGEAWVALARRVEELGYATLLVVDRVQVPLAPLTALAVAANVTTRLRVGSHVFCNDYRHGDDSSGASYDDSAGFRSDRYFRDRAEAYALKK